MSKRAPYTYGIDRSGKTYWRSLDEHAGSPEFQTALAREFPDGASELADGVSRRSFVGLLGATLGLAGLTGCRRPEEKILPFNKRPEDLIPGIAQFYATVMPWNGTSVGLLVEAHEGRPTKIEGNPKHPESLGRAGTFAQAAILDLYDPSRSSAPAKGESLSTWTEASAALAQVRDAAVAKQGQGLAILTDGHRSPALVAQLSKLQSELPNTKVFRYDPVANDAQSQGARLAFGTSVDTVVDLTGAKVILSIDSDLLVSDTSAVRHANAFAAGRRVAQPGDAMNRLYVAESLFTMTGASADHRLRLGPTELPAFAAALASELASKHGLTALADVAASTGSLAAPSSAAKWLSVVAADLASAKEHAVVVVGASQPAWVHAVVAAINAALSSAHVRAVKAFVEGPQGAAGLAALSDAIGKGEVESLVILGGNPVFDGPADVAFAAALTKVGKSFHLSTHVNETSKAASWHLPRAHFLESWGDARAADGTASIVQPLVSPLLGGKSDLEVVELLLGGHRKGYEIVRSAWMPHFGLAGEKGWRKALHDGVIEGTTAPAEVVTVNAGAVAQAVNERVQPAAGLHVIFRPDSHAFDGSTANNGWLQEMPDPMTKQSWGNAALLSPTTAKKLGAIDGQVLAVSMGGATVEVPVIVAPGQADDTVALTFGQGRTVGGPAAKGTGVDTYPLRSAAAFWSSGGATAKVTGATHELARTQEHHSMEGRPLVREGTLVQFNTRPTFAREMVEAGEKKNLFNLFSDADAPKYEGHKWGMAIDLNACVGCNACMIACQSENNIPLVGKDGVIRGREMHWIRVDRYYEGTPEDPTAVMQPIACQHCENAPCELVCPVAATVHSTEGTNDMAYNRCVGTRYCANNCPYKVRRFNFFHYNKDVPELRKMQFNPNVTVRARGVMEKCSYCIQRVQEAKIEARRKGRVEERNGQKLALVHVDEDKLQTACQQTCPAEAIVFGDYNDKEGRLSKLTEGPRSYGLLAEINTRPRTQFLARIRNPNPELA